MTGIAQIYKKALDAFKRFEREKMAEMGVSDG